MCYRVAQSPQPRFARTRSQQPAASHRWGHGHRRSRHHAAGSHKGHEHRPQTTPRCPEVTASAHFERPPLLNPWSAPVAARARTPATVVCGWGGSAARLPSRRHLQTQTRAAAAAARQEGCATDRTACEVAGEGGRCGMTGCAGWMPQTRAAKSHCPGDSEPWLRPCSASQWPGTQAAGGARHTWLGSSTTEQVARAPRNGR